MNAKFPTKKTRPLTPPTEAPPRAALEKTGPLQIDISCIEPHPDNPREEFDEGELQALAASMETLTLMQPVQLTRAPGASERFQLIAGERRWRAAKLAGWKTISAYVVKADARLVVEMMVDENLQHKELTPIETARSLDLLTRPVAKGGAGLTHARAAEKFGHQAAWASNLLRLLALPGGWQVRIATGEITVREARAIATYAERPDVLAAVETDRKSHPDDWRTSADFERQLKFIAERLDGLTAATAAAAELGDVADDDADGEETFPREVSTGSALRVVARSLPPAAPTRGPAGKPACPDCRAALPGDGSCCDECGWEWHGGGDDPRLPSGRTVGAIAAATLARGAVKPQEAEPMIVGLLDLLTDLEALERVQDALHARGAVLRKPAKRKPAKDN